MKDTVENGLDLKPEISLENFIFPIGFCVPFALFIWKMGAANMINTMLNTAYALLMDTVLYITAICVLMSAISALLSEFGTVTLADRLLRPFMRPVYGLPGAASLGIVTTFLSDNPAVLALAEDDYFKHYFAPYQLPALTNLGTSFGMGLIVCTYMLSLGPAAGQPMGKAVAVGLLGAVIGSIISTRIMLVFTKKHFGVTPGATFQVRQDYPSNMRPVRHGSVCNRLMAALLEGGANGVKLGVSIVPGVLIICTLVMMLIGNPSESGAYTGAAYEGIHLLPDLADKIDFLLKPLFGFSSPEGIGVPVTALGAAGAAMSLVSSLISQGKAGASDVAVFTAMCMCWSGYLSTHASMMNSLGCKELIGKAIISHTIGGLCAGVAAHWIYVLLSMA